MGNQGHSGDGIRVMLRVDRRRRHRRGPRGPRLDQPAGLAAGHRSRTGRRRRRRSRQRLIGTCGSARPRYRPYHPAYHPAKWRAWWDFGTGSLGDLGCHILDAPFWALKLKYPVSVEGCISTYWDGFWNETEPKNEQYPRSTIVRYQFPAREGMPAVKLTWWDGGLMPPRPEELEEGRHMGDGDGGVLFLGDKGMLMCGCYGSSPRLIPETNDAGLQAAAPRRSTASPAAWADTRRTGSGRARAASRPARTSTTPARLSEMVLMGNLAVRFPNRRLLWDGEKMEVTNDAEANAYVRRQYRKGWRL